MALPTPKDAQEAARMARCWEKAQGLLSAGYIVRVDLPVVTMHRPDGEAVYFLNVQDGEVVHCTCPDFTERGNFCKHLLCAQNLLDAQEDAEWDRRAQEWAAERYR